jgi:Pectate lyase superfamily protein
MSTDLSKRMLLSKGALTAGLGVGALALMVPRAEADTPFSSFTFPATGAPVPRTMPDRLAEVKNVKDFGAVGDGYADDTAAIRRTVNWTTAANRGVIFFPPGTYKVTGPITFDGDGISIIFQGVGSQSRLIGSHADYILKRAGVFNPTAGLRVIEKLHFENANPAGGCVRLDSSVGAAVRDCYFGGFRCLDAGGNQSFTIDACTFTGGGQANAVGIVVGGNCTIMDCDLSGFKAAIRPCGVGVNIIGCRIEVNSVGIELGLDGNGANVSLDGFSIIGCSFESNGIAVDFATGAGRGFLSSLKIHGFEGGAPGGTNPQYGIRVIGNTSQGTTFSGIDIGGQMQVASFSVGNTYNRAGLTFIGCGGTNASTRGGVIWQLPVTAHTATFIGCYSVSGATTSGVLPTYTFSNLPGVPAEGEEYTITDSNTAVWGAMVAGGGTNRVKVRYNGTNWTVVGR